MFLLRDKKTVLSTHFYLMAFMVYTVLGLINNENMYCQCLFDHLFQEKIISNGYTGISDNVTLHLG